MSIIEINKLYHPWVGGVETHVKDIAEGLKDEFNIEVVCCNTKKKTVIETISDIKVTKYKSWGRLFSQPISFAFIKNLSRHTSDILHFHLPNPLAVITYFFTRPKGEIVITWHSDIIKQKFILFFYRPFLQWFIKKANKIIVTSPNMAKNSPFLNHHQHKIEVIPLGINPNDYKPKKLIKKHPRFALFVGRFIYYKGVIELIEAMKRCNVTVIMIGEGPLKPIIKKNGHDLIKKKQLIIYPFQDKSTLTAFFNACEFFILPSTHASEAFGIVQLEAMIYGKPIISTNLPTGVPYVNQHKQTGFIVEPGNINDLSHSMETLWNNDHIRALYGKNAKERCLANFTQNQMLTKTKILMRKIQKQSIKND